MKTEPRDIDREAARLFIPVAGMRVWFIHDWTPSRILNGAGMARWERGGSDFAVETSGPLGLDAIDTDDPATVGCMLAQVEAAYAEDLHVVWIRFPTEGDAGWVVQPADWSMSLDGIGFDLTRGAALVAAMRALKADPTR